MDGLRTMKLYSGRVWIAAAFLALLFSDLASSALAEEITVELPGVIEAREGSFYLGEYAEFSGGGIADSASMAVIEPTDGRFTADDVIRALGATAVAGKSVVLRMPEYVTVVPESPVASQLRALTSWKWRIDVSGDDDARDGKFSLPPRVLPGARSVTAKLSLGEGRVANKQVKLRWFQPVVYSQRDLARDERADPLNLRLRIETIGMTTQLAWDVSQLRHSTLRRAVGAGEAIPLAAVEDAMIVRSGSSVKLIASVNGLGVEVHGIALQRGGMGDVIKVRNLSTRKILFGRVIDVGRVAINASKNQES
jgi:flagella basal body P-ring formation protein FlgA